VVEGTEEGKGLKKMSGDESLNRPPMENEAKSRKKGHLSVSLINDPILPQINDKTPTPTNFGLCSLRSGASTTSNPFDEQFKAAAAASGGVPIVFNSQTSVEGASGGTGTSLNTPQIFPHLLETSTGNTIAFPSSPPPIQSDGRKFRSLVPKKQEESLPQPTIDHPKATLVEPLAQLKATTALAIKKRNVTKGTVLAKDPEEGKKQELLERNRAAAKRSRLKKKRGQEDLARDNQQLRLAMRRLQTENVQLKEEVKKLRAELLLSSQQHQVNPSVVTINPATTLILPSASGAAVQESYPSLLKPDPERTRTIVPKPDPVPGPNHDIVLDEGTVTANFFQPPAASDFRVLTQELAPIQPGLSSGFVRVAPGEVSIHHSGSGKESRQSAVIKYVDAPNVYTTSHNTSNKYVIRNPSSNTSTNTD